jgi:uncharacterized Tic20 family protein
MTDEIPAGEELASEDPVGQAPVPDEHAWSEPVDSDSRGWAVAAHLTPLFGFGFIGPLIIWLIKRDEDAFVEEHSREALNFQISVLIYAIVSGLLILVLIGLLLLPVLVIFWFVASIVAAIKTANGQAFRYPLTIRFVSR